MKYMLDTNICIYAKNQLAMPLFLSPITILECDHCVAEGYGWVRAELEKREHQLSHNFFYTSFS